MQFIQKINLFLIFEIFALNLTAFKPIENTEFNMIYSNETSFLPLSEGIYLKEGMNIYAYMDGEIKNEKLSFNYALRGNSNKDISKVEIFKLYSTYHPGNFLLTYGKLTRTIGVSENSIILSKNAPPFLMLDITNKEPLKLIGKWNFELLNGWLKEKRIDNSNPKIIILRVEYMPYEMVKFAITRFSEYGGDKRPGIKLWEYPELISGNNENITRSKYDSDGYLGFDLAINLKGYFKNLDEFNIYFQQVATDISAFWQKEDKKKIYFPFIVKPLANSYQGGFKIKVSSNIYQFELTTINDLAYIHHYYWYEGYSYKGFCLGEAYGNNLIDLYFSHTHIRENGYFKYKIGYVRQPAFSNSRSYYPLNAKKIYLEIENLKLDKYFKIKPLFRVEYDKNYDRNTIPVQHDIIKVNKILFTALLSIGF